MRQYRGAADQNELIDLARQVRADVIRAVYNAQGGHIGGPLSCTDLLVALYFRKLNVRPEEPDWPDRDRFVLSKGHSAVALYATMAARGYFDRAELLTFDLINSRLQGHPDMTSLPGLDMSTGSLGQGLSPGLGIALGAKQLGASFHTWVMLGDGECQEGQVWEAAFVAARYGLNNLTAIVDLNALQQYGWPGQTIEQRLPPWTDSADLAARWAAFGWHCIEIDGHDFDQILPAYDAATAYADGPTVIIASTVKGKGVSFMAGAFEWHARVPTADEAASALQELGWQEGMAEL